VQNSINKTPEATPKNDGGEVVSKAALTRLQVYWI